MDSCPVFLQAFLFLRGCHAPLLHCVPIRPLLQFLARRPFLWFRLLISPATSFSFFFPFRLTQCAPIFFCAPPLPEPTVTFPFFGPSPLSNSTSLTPPAPLELLPRPLPLPLGERTFAAGFQNPVALFFLSGFARPISPFFQGPLIFFFPTQPNGTRPLGKTHFFTSSIVKTKFSLHDFPPQALESFKFGTSFFFSTFRLTP